MIGKRIAPRISLCCVILITSCCRQAFAQTVPADSEFFEKRVRPILAERCYACHSANAKPIAGGLRLDSVSGIRKGGSRGSLFASDDPTKSLLLAAILHTDGSLRMPPGRRLSDEQLASMKAWILRGAPLPAAVAAAPISPAPFEMKSRLRHWAWQPVRKTSPPAVKNRTWPRNPVDAFILSRLEAKGLSPAPPADRAALLRRVTFDLIGLPPTPQELHAFLNDRSANAYEKVVDRLLASPHYGERWGRHWLDLVRYAETDGHEWDLPKEGAYAYRDYVIRAFNADVPYNQFVAEHIAGDLLPTPRSHPTEHYNESRLGTGFLWLGAGKHSPVDLCDDQADRIDNQIDVIGKAFLGVTLGCARCHDHKFDAISTRDYYALFGFLKSTRMATCAVGAPISMATQDELNRLQIEMRTVARQNSASSYAAFRKFEGSEWSRLLDADKEDAASPFYPAARLCRDRGNRSGLEFDRERRAVIERLAAQGEQAAKEAASTHWLPGFSETRNAERWTATGDAFSGGSADFPYVRLWPLGISVTATAIPAGAVCSGAVSDRLTGVLRSPTFVIDHDSLHYHIAGTHARARLVVEGYVRKPIEIIHGGLTIDINLPGRLQWLTQNVSQYRGHRAYAELIADENGFVACDRIGLTDGAPPAETPNPLIARLLNDPSITSSELLESGYAGLLRTASNQLQAGKLNAADSAAWNSLLCVLLQETPRTEETDRALNRLMTERKVIEAQFAEPPIALAATDGTGEDSPVYRRGSYKTPGPRAPRRFLEACDHQPAISSEAGSGRLELARRMTDVSDPLLPRVIVNRLWQHHFGEGIVRTPDDFGVMGERPTHPELLDWLTATFVEQGWSLKKMHRMMTLSQTYRMSSQPVSAAEQADPQNRLLHRMPIRRLEAEAIRDAILSASGRLDRTLYGPPVMPHLNAFTPGRGAPASGPLDGDGRRSIYISIRRNFPIPLFLAFDYPVPVTTIGRRTVSSVPAQALALLNDPFIVEQAGVWAKRIVALPGTPEQRITDLYETALCRAPSNAERNAAMNFLTEQEKLYAGPNDARLWSDLCHVMFNVKEFIFIH